MKLLICYEFLFLCSLIADGVYLIVLFIKSDIDLSTRVAYFIVYIDGLVLAA